MIVEEMGMARVDSLSMHTEVEVSTNLCITDKDEFFTSILSSLTNSITLQSSHLTDLVLLCTGPDGLIPISVHAAVLSSQSVLLKDLLLSVTDPVLVLPEVEVNTVRSLLDLLYTGRCVGTKQQDRFKLVNLLISMGMGVVASSLEREASDGDLLYQSLSDRLPCAGSANLDVTQPRSEIDCKVCGEKFSAKQAVEFFFHERECRPVSKKVLSPVEEENDPIVETKSSSSSTGLSNLAKPRKCVSKYKGHFCQMCGKKVRNTSKLRDHYTSKHFYGEIRALIVDEKSHSCQFCGKKLEGGDNLTYHMVRHVGVTHEKVLPLVERECGEDVISCDRCQMCRKSVDTSVSVLGSHLLEKHFKAKIESLVTSDQSECYICNTKVKSFKELVKHVGIFHGRAMKWYKEYLATVEPSILKPKKIISKNCHLCGVLIAGAGTNWRYPLYAHLSRRHFAKELIRDYQIEENKCNVCGKEEKSKSRFAVHVGATHRLVENCLDVNEIKKYETLDDSAPQLEIKGDYAKKSKKRKNLKSRRLQLEVTELAQTLMDEAEKDGKTSETGNIEEKLVKSVRRKTMKGNSKAEANICCPFCEKKVVKNPVLQSHLFSRHFKTDCEEGIKQVLERTGGVCPLCPKFRWSNTETLGWKIFIHFARKHKITDDLEFCHNLPNQDNVKKIVERFCPQ